MKIKFDERLDVLISKRQKDTIRRLVFDGRYKNPSEWVREAIQEKIDGKKEGGWAKDAV